MKNQPEKKRNLGLLQFLNGNGYGVYNRQLARLIGPTAAIFLGELIDRFLFYQRSGKTISIDGEEGFFYVTTDDMFERTGMTRENQETAFKVLKNHKLAVKKIFGLPGKKHYRLNLNEIESFISENFQEKSTKLGDSHNLDCGNPAIQFVGIPQTAPYSNNPKEDPKSSSSPPSQKSQSPPISEEEEDFLLKKEQERKADEPIKFRSRWRKAVLKDYRENLEREKESSRLLVERVLSHRAEAEKHDLKTYKGFKVYALDDRVEFSYPTGRQIVVFYAISEEEWRKKVVW